MTRKIRLASIKQYWPLISLLLISMVSALAINWHLSGDLIVWMHYFMGIFLIFLSMLKIFHPHRFAEGFARYDILAKRTRVYAYSYPLIELTLGLLYLSFSVPTLVYVLTIFLLSFGSIGVIKGLHRGLDMNCPCMGSVLDVPLSTVTLIEDIGMALMALMLLLKKVI